MGTNYYAVRKKPSLYNREIHIGKSSVGWLFLFHDCDEFHTYPQFKKWLEREVPNEYVLFNEYGEEVLKEEKEKQAKIKLLKQVYWDEKNLKRLQEKLEKITIKIESIRSSNISSMPKSSGLAQDISDLLGQQEEYQSLIIKKIMKLEESRQKAESSIDTLEDSRLKLILNYVYLEDMTFKEIAVDLRKSERHIRRLHDIAIRLMKIVKN